MAKYDKPVKLTRTVGDVTEEREAQTPAGVTQLEWDGFVRVSEAAEVTAEQVAEMSTEEKAALQPEQVASLPAPVKASVTRAKNAADSDSSTTEKTVGTNPS